MTDAEKAENASSLEKGSVLGAYVIEEHIGAGGFGEVYRAKHSVIGREVAIKVLHRRYSEDAEAVARFVAEARAVNKVSHPGIVDIHDFGTVDGRQYCVMELVKGTTLRDLLRDKSKLTLDEALPILRGVADALDAAHGAGVAHRDIKPDNIFVTSEGVKLIDFGLAKLTHGEDAVPVTQTGAVFGTPMYMSPEQCRGKNIDQRTDQYSFGVVAYQMLTGATPFSGEALELALHHLNDPPPPPNIDERVDRVLLALLAKDPADRPKTLREAVDALVGEAPLPTVRKLRRPLLVGWRGISAGIAVIGLVVGAGWFALRTDPAKPAVDDCASGTSRLGGIWDLATRSLIAGKFAAIDRSDVHAAWHSVSTTLDGYTAKWAVKWDEACRSKDKQDDPLLYVQRKTCLDNAQIVLRGVTQSLLRHDIGMFSESFTGDFLLASLRDCETIAVLRTQLPAPPPDKREAVAAQLIDAYNARTDARDGINVGRPGATERAVARLTHVVDELEKLHPPSALEPAYWRASYMYFLPGHQKEAADARAHLHELATRVGDERFQAMAFFEEAIREFQTTADAAKALALVEQGEQAAARAGKPYFVTTVLERVRGQYEAILGRHDDAIKHLRHATQELERESTAAGFNNGHPDLVNLLIGLGRYDEALAEARQFNELIQRFTGGYPQVHSLDARNQYLYALWVAGKRDEALAEGWHLLDDLEQLRHLPVYREKVDQVIPAIFVMAHDLDRPGLVDKVLARYRALQHPDHGITTLELMGIGSAALNRNDLAASQDALERAVDDEHGDVVDRAQAADLGAYVAFMLHEPTKSATFATRALADDLMGRLHKNGLAPWLLAWADAAQGRRAAVMARLAQLHRAQSEVDLAHVFVLAELGEWREALPHALAALKTTPAQAVFDRAEAYAWLGVVQVEVGDHAAAIPNLEEALRVLVWCCGHEHYFAADMRFALARALVATNGDRKRAHDLAVEARAQFPANREAERKRVDAWLAANP